MKVGALTLLVVTLGLSLVWAEDITNVTVAAVDAKGTIHTWGIGSHTPAPWRNDMVKGFGFSIHSKLLRGGAGVFGLNIDLKTGRVRKVAIVTSTGSRTLDTAVRSGLYESRWRPETWQRIELPITIPNPGEAIVWPAGVPIPKKLF